MSLTPHTGGSGGGGELIDIATIHRDGPLMSSTVGVSIDEANQILSGLDDVVVSAPVALTTYWLSRVG